MVSETCNSSLAYPEMDQCLSKYLMMFSHFKEDGIYLFIRDLLCKNLQKWVQGQKIQISINIGYIMSSKNDED